ncbi:MAG TPA: VOC family protein [Pyrinomonadaceae bacterium]|nr:VOC family protein [Acidobacteriota bacterium]HQZ96033.1 VOC family protein [Pyrinomonadaceae bacterium]
MKITELTPLMRTEDLAGTIEFYTSVLGFSEGEVNFDWGWTTLWIDEVAVMFAKPNEHMPYEKIGFTGTFYFTTDNVDAMWEKVKDKAKICYGIEEFEWGMREFAVYDNNGYILQFGQEIKAE